MKEQTERALELLTSSVHHFRKGEDPDGLRCFLAGIGRLGPEQVSSLSLRPAAQGLLLCIRNGDIAGLTDILEFSLCPALRGQSGEEGADAFGK